MHKIICAALLLFIGFRTAQAADKTSIILDCAHFDVYVHAGLASGSGTDDCDGGTIVLGGIKGKRAGQAFVTLSKIRSDAPDEQVYFYVLDYPFVSGGKYTLYATSSDGTSVQVQDSATYQVVGP